MNDTTKDYPPASSIFLTVGRLTGNVEQISLTLEGINKQLVSMNRVLAHNTAIVDEHQKRSTRLEKTVDGQVKTLTELTTTLVKVQSAISRVEEDVAPLVEHVEEYNKKVYIVEFFKNLGWIGKSITGLLTLSAVIASAYGFVVAFFKV